MEFSLKFNFTNQANLFGEKSCVTVTIFTILLFVLAISALRHTLKYEFT